MRPSGRNSPGRRTSMGKQPRSPGFGVGKGAYMQSTISCSEPKIGRPSLWVWIFFCRVTGTEKLAPTNTPGYFLAAAVLAALEFCQKSVRALCGQTVLGFGKCNTYLRSPRLLSRLDLSDQATPRPRSARALPWYAPRPVPGPVDVSNQQAP